MRIEDLITDIEWLRNRDKKPLKPHKDSVVMKLGELEDDRVYTVYFTEFLSHYRGDYLKASLRVLFGIGLEDEVTALAHPKLSEMDIVYEPSREKDVYEHPFAKFRSKK